MQIYFARSIRGQHAEGEKVYFKAIVDAIKKCGHVPALETKVGVRVLNHVSQDQFIHDRDIEWIDGSQAMIAEVSNPSLGVGYEIAYAKHVRKIPIMAVAFKDTKVSAMISGGLEVLFYRDTSDLTAWIEAFFEDVLASQRNAKACCERGHHEEYLSNGQVFCRKCGAQTSLR
jgi:hypothetical protein